MTDIPPALLAALEGKNHELKQHHLAARIGDYQGSRVQAVRDVLDEWEPEEGTPLYALWWQVQQATQLYEAEINRVREESRRDVPGIGETP